MMSGCASITAMVILSTFSFALCKPFLGEILARAIASSSSPDDPQSHISDFRNTSKMDTNAARLVLAAFKDVPNANRTLEVSNETLTEDRSAEGETEFIASPVPSANSPWFGQWNRTEVLARIIDEFVRPVQKRIILAFQTLVASNRTKTAKLKDPTTPTHGAEEEGQALQLPHDNETDIVGLELESLDEHSLPPLINPTVNGSTLLSKLRARRHMIRRRVAKALSSITGLLILAANTQRESKPRSRRSIRNGIEDEELSDGLDHVAVPDLPNELSTAYGDDPTPVDDEPKQSLLGESAEADAPRRNVETIGIFMLEVFGSIAGFSWGVFKQIQSLFW
ncbi:uncharacterized protein LOC131207004 [Anopheles bellator]|uniref:uncharacterized protein LOC131207004 n=1 Tax=Anopheles bellator TaxID=139047 RepID=UPI0026470D22|nr:uncharacterized protein LOC131207004 [Anopheles bellator]